MVWLQELELHALLCQLNFWKQASVFMVSFLGKQWTTKSLHSITTLLRRGSIRKFSSNKQLPW